MKKYTTLAILSFLISSLLILPKDVYGAITNTEPVMVSEAAVLIENETEAILYEKNADRKMYPASLTKIATAIYAIENGNLSDQVTVSENAAQTEGTSVYLEVGEKVPLEKLIQGMLINSGNDAAVAIAEHLSGNVQQFSEDLNDYLSKQVKTNRTHFTNPSGLFDENHFTTARDLGLITNYALKNKVFKEIFGTKQLPWQGKSWNTTLYSHNKLLNGEIPFDGKIVGGKTGFVDESKQTLATTAENGKLVLTAIILKGNTKKEVYSDTEKLFDYGFTHYKTSLLKTNQIFKEKGLEYRLPIEQRIAEEKEGSQQRLNTDGKLEIRSSNGHLLQTIDLRPLVKKPEIKQKQQKTETAATSWTSYSSSISLFVLLALAAVAVTLKKKSYSN